jgi:uncharacterized protein (TIGR03083 family)
MSDSVWPMLEAERRSFADYLQTLTPADWEHESLCEGWRVKDVVAHVVAGAKSTPGSFLLALIGSGFNFDTVTAKGVQSEVDKAPSELVAELRSVADRKTRPGPALLGEVLVHTEDVRRSLGAASGQYPAAHLHTIADYYKKAGPPLRVKARIKGLTLESTDLDWSTGDGPTVSGPTTSLLLAMTGRRAGIADLAGPGVAELDQRL